MIPVVLTIAGSDCSSGAGLQADLKTFQYFHVYGLTAVTCVVSETPNEVSEIYPIPAEIVSDQIRLLLQSYPVAAIKTGMLFSEEHILAITEILKKYPEIPLIVDPIMIASTGDSLITNDAVEAYKNKLFPIASLITPNIPEAETLLSRKIKNESDMEKAAIDLSIKNQFAVLLKGGHLETQACIDLLFNGEVHRFESQKLAAKASHGTGCTLSSAITANIALGYNFPKACRIAKKFVYQSLTSSFTWNNEETNQIHALNQGTTS
jgi:hydroxymethylpyrimidine/phosphomethylpyrimidine kinase